MCLRSGSPDDVAWGEIPAPNYEYLDRESYREGRFSEEGDLADLARRFEVPAGNGAADKQDSMVDEEDKTDDNQIEGS